MIQAIRNISWPVTLLLVGFLGLAPFVPEPHIWQKLKMLFAGELSRAIDWFDLVMHGAPFLLLAVKLGDLALRRTK
ncbi:RND transporter [Rhodobacteraceae bacterium 63075]|nr:RND transporter [Rhodobacteraceae bacterium 63075]